MQIPTIRRKLVKLGMNVADIRVKDTTEGPHVCVYIKNDRWVCAAVPIENEKDEEFADYLFSERNKALKK